MKNRRTDALSTAAIGDEDYRSWLKRLKSQVRSAQVKAAIRVNIELLQLYWNMGHDIAEKHLDAAYGSGFFDRLSRDLKAEFPHMEQEWIGFAGITRIEGSYFNVVGFPVQRVYEALRKFL